MMSQHSLRPRVQQRPLRGSALWPWLIAVALLSILLGAAIGLGLQVAVLAVFGLPVLLLVVVLLLPATVWQHGGALLLSLGVVALLGSYLMTVLPRGGGVLADLWTACAAVAAIPFFFRWLRSHAFPKALVALYLVYLVLSIASTLANPHGLRAPVYQLLYNFKLPAMILCGLAIGWSVQREAAFRRVALIGAAVAVLVVAFEIAAPGLYRAVAAGSIEKSVTPNPLLHGLLSRKSGPYLHSGVLAMNASFAGCAFLLLYLSRSGSRIGNLVGFFVCVALVVLSGQQQESLGFVCSIALVLVCMRTRPSLAKIVASGIVLVLLGGGLVALLGERQIAALLSEWGVGSGVHAVNSARPVFYADGAKLASESFPLGIGLGRFGSVGAQLFDHSVYQSLGYEAFWWYRLDQFLLDTYWPNIIAETGWLGAAILAFALLATLSVSIQYWWREEASGLSKNLWGLASIGQLLVLMASLTAPQYGNPSGSVWLLAWLGIAFRHSYLSAGPNVGVDASTSKIRDTVASSGNQTQRRKTLVDPYPVSLWPSVLREVELQPSAPTKDGVVSN